MDPCTAVFDLQLGSEVWEHTVGGVEGMGEQMSEGR